MAGTMVKETIDFWKPEEFRNGYTHTNLFTPFRGTVHQANINVDKF